MELVIDTHALHWFLEDSKTLSKRAASAMRDASRIYIPSIVLMEGLYIAKKYNQLTIYKDFLKTLPNEKFSIYTLDLEIVKETATFANTLEIHDAIIVATADYLNIPLLSKDSEITNVYKKTIW